MSQPTRKTYRIVLKRVASLCVLLLLWATAASDRLPASLSMAAHAAGKAAADARPHDLSALRIFNRVVLLIKDNYVDPKRIEPRKMLINALDGVERQVAEVMVDGDEKSPKITVTVNKLSKQFDVSEVDTFWRMSFALKEMFDFIAKSLSPSERDETREIEYAAVNGMLSTLDPHSILLKPEYFKEMKLQTKGEFGGLGFVIQMKESNLTVVRVIKDTPAFKAGIKSKDQISRINNESTVNMDLTEAVNRLRGKPGSEVSITVKREGWPAPKPLTLTRAIINVESVSAKMLDGNIGYIRLKGFQGNTARDMRAELAKLKAQAGKAGLKGLVLDMRGNPGGLLEQAIQVSDAFVSHGSIVTTVGYSDKLREVKKAQPEETEEELPLVALVNSGSASASEIVAGALKNLNRALVIGRQTFGKGSVQVLYDFPDESALKLTIAQYLTPGDKSIQEVGITPDIELLPSRVAKDRVDVFAPKKLIGEANLDKHFGNPDSDKVASKRDEVERKEQPLEQLRYLRDEPKKLAKGEKERPDRDDYDDLDELEGLDPDTEAIVEDFPIRFARDLLVAAPFSERDKMLQASQAFIAERRAQEQEKIHKAIETLGIDWAVSGAAKGGAGKLVAQMSPAPTEPVKAGEKLAWTVTAKNEGESAFRRLRAYSESENPYLDRREFIFGALAPGEQRAWTVNIQLPKDMVSRRDKVTLRFFADGAEKLEELEGELAIVELPRPTFAYNWQLLDRCDKCNGDGLAQRGETVEMALEVKNLGPGTAFDPIAMLKNKEADENLSLQKGRAKLGELKPGESKGGVFEFEVTPGFKGEAAILQLTIGDEPMDEWVSETLPVSVREKGLSPAKVSAAAVRALADLSIRAAADEATAVIAEAKKGTVLPVESRLGDFYRVKLGSRAGFVLASEVREARAEKTAPRVELLQTRREPKIELDIDVTKGGVVTDSDKFTLTGRATDNQQLRDLYVFVNEQKVFFKAASEEGGKSIEFSADCPLKEGNNTVLVVARKDQDLMARKLLIMHRRAAQLAQKETKPEK